MLTESLMVCERVTVYKGAAVVCLKILFRHFRRGKCSLVKTLTTAAKYVYVS